MANNSLVDYDKFNEADDRYIIRAESRLDINKTNDENKDKGYKMNVNNNSKIEIILGRGINTLNNLEIYYNINSKSVDVKDSSFKNKKQANKELDAILKVSLEKVSNKSSYGISYEVVNLDKK